jgi:N-acetylneuraminate synthase
MKIERRIISDNFPPFIIAELSANHNNNLSRMLKLIDEAKKAGADAVKIQTYTADTMTLDSKKRDFFINDKHSLWHGKYLYELYKNGSTPWEWHKEIFERAKKNNIICFSTPFDETAVDFLNKFKVPAFKIASFENNHVPLIEKIITCKRPIIVSLGLTTIKDITSIIKIFKNKRFKNFSLLKCTSSYPAKVSESNLKTISDLKKKFNVQIGLSDHTPGIGAAIASISYGASIIEKHFTLNKKSGGLDDSFSIEPNELNNLVVESKRAWQSKGKVYYGISKSESRSLIFKRSIYASANIKKGEKFTINNIKVVRPSFGVPPKYFSQILGMKSLQNIKKASPIKKNFYRK